MSRSRSLLSGAFVVVLASYVLGLFALIASGMASQALREQVANTAGLAPALMTAFVCFAAARNTLLESRVRAAWRWIALACLCAWFGDASWFVIESLMHQQPQASVADIGYLSFYPIMMVGLLAFPHAARSRSDRLKMWLDVALIVCACAAALWQFAVSPDRLANHKNLAVFTVTVSQPIGDLVTLLGVTVLWLRRSGGPRDRVITLLVLGVMTNVVADMFYAYQVRAGTYESGGFIEVAWVVNYLLIALAAFSERDDATSAGDKPHRAQRPLLTMAMPYLAIGLVSLMLVRLVFADGNLNLQVAVIATTVMTALVVVRQMAAARENLRLNAEVTAAEGEQRLHSLIQNSTDVIAILDVDATVRYVSPSLERLAGIPGSAIIGQRLIDNIHPDDQSKAILFFATLAKDGVIDLRGEWRMATVSGDWRLTENVGSNLMNEPTVKGLVLNTRDITERQALETQLRYQAFHDPLTGAANRSLFSDRVEHAFRRSSRDRRAMAVLFIDLDNFKHINDTLGHAAGDEVLKVVSQRMRACLREGDTLARLGGDEFAVLLEDLTDVADADVAGERIIESLKRPIPLANGNPVVGASIGVTGGADGSSAEQLLRNADVAMYVAKSKQKGTHKRFTADMQNKVMERLELEADLRRAVQENQFVLQYQPIVGLSAGNLSSVEALMRWDHPTKGRLQPGSFIKVAEETGLITQMGRWALGEATRQVRRWQQASGRTLRVGVNISMRHLCHPTMIADVKRALAESQLDPKYLLIEITESVLMTDAAEVIPVLLQLKKLGVQIALDDFGTGYSSLSYLQDMPIDVLKIDKSFVDRIGGEQPDPVLVKAIVSLGATLMLRVVAEGIETSDQLDHLHKLGCDLGQGFYFEKAVDADEMLSYLVGENVFSAQNMALAATIGLAA